MTAKQTSTSGRVNPRPGAAGHLRIPVGNGDHIRGAADAPITLVEYGDYECPYCGAAYPIVRQVEELMGGRMRFVFRNFPLADMHANAVSAAMAAEFGESKGVYWQFHDALFENQTRLGNALYEAIAEMTGVSAAELLAQLRRDTYAARIRNDIESGMQSGVRGTPTFFINGRRYEGEPSLDVLLQALAVA